MKEGICCPACGGSLILHCVGSYADDYQVDEAGKISARRKKRTIYPTDRNLTTVYCGKCYETYTNFETDENNKITLITEKT